MKVNFDLVRIGEIRKKKISETLIKQNVKLLKSNIRYLLENVDNDNKSNEISMVIIIPGKGYDIKIALRDVRDKNIKRILQQNYPNNIYKGSYSTIMDNINNRIY